jgi:hypothetical protein
MYIRHISDGWCKNPSSSAMDQSELRTFGQILTHEKVSIPKRNQLEIAYKADCTYILVYKCRFACNSPFKIFNKRTYQLPVPYK